MLCICMLGVLLLFLGLTASPLYALRANMMKNLERLEDMGHYERVLYYRKSTMDMVMALHVQWSGVAYDPQMDEIYDQLDNVYGTGEKTRHRQAETRIDRRYWNLVNGQKRPIAELLAKAKLTPFQIQRLNERVRVYVEDHLSPEFDEMGNFFFRRKAMIFEQTGLFWDASFRRYLTGHYDMRVCAPYYAVMAEEFENDGQQSAADAYRRKSQWYREQAIREFRRADGDRLLSELQGDSRRKRLAREQVVEVLKAGLESKQSTARFAAALNLADLGETKELLSAAEDPDLEIRREVARITAASQPMLLKAENENTADPANGLKPGLLVQYFSEPGQPPIVERTVRTVDLGFRGNERLPDLIRAHWYKEDIFPPDVEGQFLLKFRGMIYLPEDGQYQFYVKTEGNNRATVRLTASSEEPGVIISPENDKELMYADQCNWDGGSMSRVDFSHKLDLKAGLIDLEIDYKGGQIRGDHGTAGIRLYWSSDGHVMETVSASTLFHKSR